MSNILTLDHVLHLGVVDRDSFAEFQTIQDAYFKKFHNKFWSWYDKSKRSLFRGDGQGEWIKPKPISGSDVSKLQQFLIKRGFMPFGKPDGIYGYVTLSAVRLFQEYLRTIEQIEGFGVPDGRVGNGTHKQMIRWVQDDLHCLWAPGNNSSREYDLWMDLLPKVKMAYKQQVSELNSPSSNVDLFQIQELEKYNRKADTLKIDDWSFNRNDIHLVGLRCNQEKGIWKRGSDDLFLLLINGKVFKFWGSTDPNPKSSLKQEPYLLEGQHKYRLSWHKVSRQDRVYKALTPYSKGVLVFRDWDGNNSLNESDIRRGLEYNPTGKSGLDNPNLSINIHWSGYGYSNWSAGCQVISGNAYVNDRGNRIDCSDFAASFYDKLSHISKKGVKRTSGAYTFMSDLVLAYTPPGKDYLLYTLGRDGTVQEFASAELLTTLAKENVLKSLQTNADGMAIVHGLVDQMKGSGLA